MTSAPTTSFDDFAELVRSRRTHMLVERDRLVPAETVDQLCALATWAPNHKKTWPWRFASLTGEARRRLGEAFVADMVDRDYGDAGKRTKTLTKYTRTPNLLAVGCAPHDNPMLDDENRYAVAAGIEILLLAATAAGIASFWSTPPLSDSPRALELCGFDPADRLIGLIYLGWPVSSVETPSRPAVTVRHIS